MMNQFVVMLPYAGHSDCDEKSNVIKVFKLNKDRDVQLPNPFPFPKYLPPDVEAAIRTGEVSRAAQNGLLASIIHSVFQHKRYLTENDYINLSKQIMDKYPSFFSSQVNVSVLLLYIMYCIFL